MKGTRIFVLAAIVLAAAPCASADLAKARAEQNLERRSKLALENATAELQAAREAYRTGDSPKRSPRISPRFSESVESGIRLAQTDRTRIRARAQNGSRYAEISTRDLLRSWIAFNEDMSFNERAGLDQVKERIQQVHDDLLVGLMEGKKHK